MMTQKIKIGIIKEGKVPTDKRVVLTPKCCVEVLDKFPNVELVVQPSKIRIYLDEEYTSVGVQLSEDLSDCDYLMGVKEVPIHELIPEKKYLFFSHVIKKQHYNQKLLKSILHKNITLIDYECIKDVNDHRLIAFGYFAGVVGAYNAIKIYGHRYRLFELKAAYQCFDYSDLRTQFKKINLPAIKIAITGNGRVTQGAIEMLESMGIKNVSPEDYISKQYSEPVFTQLRSSDYNQRIDGLSWNTEHFYHFPEMYESTFDQYYQLTDILIPCAYWDPKAPVLFTKKEMRLSSFKIKVIADITCDINGSIPCTTKTTSIENPVYDYNPATEKLEVPFSNDKNITVMAVDNLPCELARDASRNFGKQMIEKVLPLILENDPHKLIHQATIAENGSLTKNFQYLSDFVA